MSNPLKQMIQKGLYRARCGLSVVKSRHLSGFMTAQSLFPDASSPPSADYIPDAQIGTAGFSLNVEGQLTFLTKLCSSPFQELFANLRSDPNINIGMAGKDYRSQGLIHNGYYPTPDAELYAAFIADFQPTRIIEIGSGFSTVIANHALRHLKRDCEIRVIDPEPRRDVASYASHIEFEMVQNSSLARESLADAQRTILFIDSSHVTKLGGDIPFLYCQLLPVVPSGVLIHVHDIFTPFDYPTNYGWRFYTEQYVLQALLAHNPKMSVRFSTHAMSRFHPAAMQKAFGPQVGIESYRRILVTEGIRRQRFELAI
jgi:Methyltransferase domain